MPAGLWTCTPPVVTPASEEWATTRRAWLRALADACPDALGRVQATHPLDLPLARWLAGQGLAPYSFFLLRREGLVDQLEPEVARGLSRAFYSGALSEAVQHQEALSGVFNALEAAGVRFVLLKGLAIAHSVYPSPRCRPKGDLDLWIAPEDHETATSALAALGYRRRDKEDRPLSFIQRYDGEQQLIGERFGTGLIELQWPAIRGQWIHQVADVDHAAVRARCVPLEIEGTVVPVLASEDTLLHQIVHLGINHTFTFPWLRALLDIHLIVTRLGPDLEAVVARAREWRLATVSWTILSLARELMGTPVPETVLRALRPSRAQRALIARLDLERSLLERWDVTFEHRRFLVQLALIDRPRDGLRLLLRALFPKREWIEARYGVTGGIALWRERLLHPWRLLVGARA